MTTLAYERLRRLLFLVPYVSRHPGQTVEEVATAAGVTRAELLSELDLLTLVGRPPFEPDDYVDIYVDKDRVFVDFDQRFSAPPRLTAAEGVALAAAAELLRPASSDALTGALQKLEKVLPEGARARYREMSKQLDLAVDAPSGLATLSQAIVEHREVEFDYFSGGKGVTERRAVQPLELFSHRGQWYLSAFCLSRQDERLFRLDRIARIELSPRTFPAPPPTGLGLSRGEDAKARVKVRFSPAAAPYVSERFGSEARWVAGGGLEVEVPGDSARWLTGWVLSFGGEAAVVEPDWAVKAVAEAARASLES